jgi:hypothetical protein
MNNNKNIKKKKEKKIICRFSKNILIFLEK